MIHLHDIWRPRSTGTGKAVTTGIISALAAAGITYFLYGTKKGAYKREKIKRWARDIKSDIEDTFSDSTDSVVDEIK